MMSQGSISLYFRSFTKSKYFLTIDLAVGRKLSSLFCSYDANRADFGRFGLGGICCSSAAVGAVSSSVADSQQNIRINKQYQKS
jgi:hypothetical protein